jgi:hypothetical protein
MTGQSRPVNQRTFKWLDGRPRSNQQIVLEGPGAEAYVPFMEEHMAGNAPKGMQKLAEEVARYAAGQ